MRRAQIHHNNDKIELSILMLSYGSKLSENILKPQIKTPPKK